jgi:hypothetical protein
LKVAPTPAFKRPGAQPQLASQQLQGHARTPHTVCELRCATVDTRVTPSTNTRPRGPA